MTENPRGAMFRVIASDRPARGRAGPRYSAVSAWTENIPAGSVQDSLTVQPESCASAAKRGIEYL